MNLKDKLKDRLKDKNIGIFGLARTGISCFNAVNPVASRVVCYDDSPEVRSNFEFSEFLLEPKLWPDNLDYVVVSPGIRDDHYIFSLDNLSSSKLVCDVELFYLLNKNINKNKKYIAITGTNGKSTTATLIHHVLSFLGLNYGLCGNIGTPIMDLVHKDYDGYVVELSSFQIDLLNKFSADVAILLNISPDHLDRYRTMDNYINSKLRLFKNAKSCILGVDDNYTKEIYKKNKKLYKIIPISSSFFLKNGVSIINNVINMNLSTKSSKKYKIKKRLLMKENPYISGHHNNQNFASCYCATMILFNGACISLVFVC